MGGVRRGGVGGVRRGGVGGVRRGGVGWGEERWGEEGLVG